MGAKVKQDKRLIFDTYLVMIQNSVGAKIWKNFYMLFNQERKDITEGGSLSCAFFVSSILKIFGLVRNVHGTIDGTVQDMKDSKWYGIKEPKPGSVIIWKGEKYKNKIHKHIGFYIGNSKAIGNNSTKKTPTLHHWTFNNKRKVIGIFWNKQLEKWGG